MYAVPGSKDSRCLLAVGKMCSLDTTACHFTPHFITKAIRNSGNFRATGPDGVTIHQIKHLSPLGIQYLTHLYIVYNLLYNYANIPSIWKTAIIIPLLKPGKTQCLVPATDPSPSVVPLSKS